jgi:hypothetical protein
MTGMLIGELDDARHVVGALAEDDRFRRRRIDRRLVTAVLLAYHARGRAALAEGRLERLDHGRRHRARRELGQQVSGQGCVHGGSPRPKADSAL